MRWLVAALCFAWVPSCARELASEQQCHAIFDRIVDIELEELGFRDPALAARHKADLQRRYARTLRDCVGHAISERAMTCVATARTTEELSHKCLQ